MSNHNSKVNGLMERQRQAEREAVRRAAERRAQLEKDRALANSLQSGSPFQSGSHSNRMQFGQSSSQAVLNRDGTFRLPSSQKSYIKPEQSRFAQASSNHLASPWRDTSASIVKNEPSPFSMGGPVKPSPFGSSGPVKNEPSPFSMGGSSNQLPAMNAQSTPWTARNSYQTINSDSSDLEEIDADQFISSARKRQQSTAMVGSSSSQMPARQPQGYVNPGMLHSQYQQPTSFNHNGMQQPQAQGYNGLSSSATPTPTPRNTWGHDPSYWSGFASTANKYIGGFAENISTLHSMVGLGSSLGLPHSMSQMPGSYPGASMSTPTNIFGNLGYNVSQNHSGSRQLPNVINLDDDDDEEDVIADRSRFNYLYSDTSRTNEEIKKLIENIAPGDDLPPEMREGTPNAMRMPLLEHQKIGLTWLKQKEEGSNKGGILADDMGLGKTIQAIALMVTRPSDQPRRKTTLIVAPVALTRQWEFEIKDKLKEGRDSLSVFKHHGSAKKTSFKDLSKYDVVLTTFGTLANELKKKERWDAVRKLNPTAVPLARERLTLIGDDCLWYRVILDEAQCIKNKNTATAKAAYLLQAEYRLCMTGTPMMNNVGELFSLVHFCRIKPFSNPDKFKNEISNPIANQHEDMRKKGMQKLHGLIAATMLRRTKYSQLDGKPIITLPPRTTEATNVQFDEDEQGFYTALETQTQLTFNRYMKAGTVMKNYANVLVLLLRLRQACCHPHLIRDYAIAGSTEVTADDMYELAQGLADEVVQRIKESGGNFECPICYDGVENPNIFIPCGHDTCSECFARLTDPSRALGQGTETAEARCPQCRGKVDPKKIIDYDMFKKVHMPETIQFTDEAGKVEEADDADEDSNSDSDSDSDDDETGSLDGFIVNDDVGDVNAEADTEQSSTKTSKPKSKKRKSGKGKGKAKEKKTHKSLAQLRAEGNSSKKARKKYMRRLAKDWIESAKIKRTLALLEEIHENNPTEKVLIFSQFTSLLDLLEVPICSDSTRYRRYDGSMTATERNDAVMYFKENAACRIMLVSLKAGNSGLNLNCASQVIIMDPFWNPYVEEQAIDRAHRIGQMNPVKVSTSTAPMLLKGVH
jgi:SNF2 family DNA or RNA helicase